MDQPTFDGADLLGDSMLLRFSLRHADVIPDFRVHPRHWGMCRSGKVAAELLVEEWTANTGPAFNERAIIMIGTNDLLRICPDSETLAKSKKPLKHTLRKIRDKAVRKYRSVFFCTVPEIPRLEQNADQRTRERYNNVLPWVNADIMTFGEKEESVTSIDLRGKFDHCCYERFMGGGGNRRPDNIHLNAEGQAILQGVLRERMKIS